MDRIDEIMFHDLLREAVSELVEDPDSPLSEVTVRGASPIPVAMVASLFGCSSGAPASKAKANGEGMDSF